MSAKEHLLSLIPSEGKDGTSSMEVDSTPAVPPPLAPKTGAPSPADPSPEGDVYLRLLIILHLMDSDDLDKAQEVAQETTDKIQALNRRFLDAIAARVYFYFARIHELQDEVAAIRP